MIGGDSTEPEPGKDWAAFQYEIYLNGMTGAVPRLPADLTRLEELAEARLGPGPVGYVAGSRGAGRAVHPLLRVQYAHGAGGGDDGRR